MKLTDIYDETRMKIVYFFFRTHTEWINFIGNGRALGI